jgi:hypothetical protein
MLSLRGLIEAEDRLRSRLARQMGMNATDHDDELSKLQMIHIKSGLEKWGAAWIFVSTVSRATTTATTHGFLADGQVHAACLPPLPRHSRVEAPKSQLGCPQGPAATCGPRATPSTVAPSH